MISIILATAIAASLPGWWWQNKGEYDEGVRLHYIKGRARGEHAFLQDGKVYVFVRDPGRPFSVEGQRGEVEWYIMGNYIVIDSDHYPVLLHFGDGRTARVDVDLDGVAAVHSVVAVPEERLDSPDDVRQRTRREDEHQSDRVEFMDRGETVTGIIEVGGSARSVEMARISVGGGTWERFRADDRRAIAERIRRSRSNLWIRAGGDMKSAAAAIEAERICREMRKTCRVSYDGAEASFVEIKEG